MDASAIPWELLAVCILLALMLWVGTYPHRRG